MTLSASDQNSHCLPAAGASCVFCRQELTPGVIPPLNDIMAMNNLKNRF